MIEYLTVTALTKYLKRKFTVDPHLQKIYLTGEVSNFRPRAKHQYFSIKDAHATIGAAIWQGVYARLPFKLVDGMKVNVTGHMDLLETSGSYSIIVDKIEPDGVGALALQFEQLKHKLAEIGLFSRSKKVIPQFPKKIAVITSPSGAVIRDIMTTVARRYPIAGIYLYPAVVQGAQAVPDLLRQLDSVAQGDYDVLIIGRGGGSMEDLWAFNDEKLAYRLADMPLPVISSVGHETDTTIADFVADQRAATPTAAAELATPITLPQVWNGLTDWQTRMVNSVSHKITELESRLQRVQGRYVLTEPNRLYEGVMQRLDLAQNRLVSNMGQQGERAEHQFALVQQRLQPAISQTFTKKDEHFRQLVAHLNLVSPLEVLARGYSVTTGEQGIIQSIDDLAVGDHIEVRLHDGHVKATITEKRKA